MAPLSSSDAVAEGIFPQLDAFDSLRDESRSEAPTLKSLITFEGSEVRLRGVGLPHVLRRGCATFDNARDSQKVRKRAVECQDLTAFISHNWSVNRWLKCFALFFHFNFDIAAIVSLLWMVGVAAATALELFPAFYDGVVPWPIGVVGQATFVPVFMLVLVFCQDVGELLGFRGRHRIFVDKLCIDQSSEELKKQSIRKLGAYISHSQTMVVLFSEIYLKKLWTTYEVAAFATVSSLDRMKILPLGKSLACMAVIFNSWPVLGARAFIMYMGIELKWARFIGYFVTAWTYLFVSRFWAKRSAALRKQVESFDIHNCMCAEESDRPLVYGNIAALLKGIGKVPQHAHQEEALQTFQKMVRDTLPGIFMPQHFKLNYLWKHYMAIGFVHGFETFVDSFSGVHLGDVSFLYFLAVSVEHIIRFAGAIPYCASSTSLVCCLDELWVYIVDRVDERPHLLTLGAVQLALLPLEWRIMLHFSGEWSLWSQKASSSHIESPNPMAPADWISLSELTPKASRQSDQGSLRVSDTSSPCACGKASTTSSVGEARSQDRQVDEWTVCKSKGDNEDEDEDGDSKSWQVRVPDEPSFVEDDGGGESTDSENASIVSF
mmetsp:Transcript_33335/g.71422  ORF Transcript_33335/g.71422 Transcript_33335/m.71422 type:complete len:605 (-) Transcript_33335:45-1859(-)